MLPTGTGGVLYRTSFFDDVIFDEHFRLATVSTDDITFRLATMLKEVKVAISCIPGIDQGLATVSHRFKCGHRYLRKSGFSLPQYPQLDLYQRLISNSSIAGVPAGGAVPAPDGKSLYDAVNSRGGNKNQWTGGVHYLAHFANKPILQLFTRYVQRERKAKCISEDAYISPNAGPVRQGLAPSYCCNITENA